MSIEKVLKTWYPIDHPLHNDPLHPAIGLAGEAGELLNLYKKERFKKGLFWWDCVTCHGPKESDCHDPITEKNEMFGYAQHSYTPKILDELGDAGYYLDILAYQKELYFKIFPSDREVPNDMLMFLTLFNFNCALLLARYEDHEEIDTKVLQRTFDWYQDILFLLNTDLDTIKELNWNKLKDGDNNGWFETRQSYTCYNCGHSIGKDDLEDCVPGQIVCKGCCQEDGFSVR